MGPPGSRHPVHVRIQSSEGRSQAAAVRLHLSAVPAAPFAAETRDVRWLYSPVDIAAMSDLHHYDLSLIIVDHVEHAVGTLP